MSPENDRCPDRAAGADLALLALALAVGALRFWRLGEWGLWIDEAFTLHDIRGIFSHAIPEPSNPLGYRLVGAWIHWLGREDEFALRALPALFGWLTIGAVYGCLRPFAGARASALAALFVAVSSWQLYWSQNARFYSIAQFFAVLAGGALARALFARERGSRTEGWVWIGAYLASSALAALSHPSAALLAVSFAAAPVVLWLARIRPSRRFARNTAALVALAVVGLFAARHWAALLWAKYRENKADPSPLHLILTTGYYVAPWLAAAAAFGVWRALRHRRPFESWVALTVCGTLLAALVLSFEARVSAQYVFVLLPWIAIAAASAIAELGRTRPWPALLATLALVLPGLADQAHYFLARHGDRERWREAYQYVWNQREPDDLVIGMAYPVAEYYLAPRSSSFKQPSMLVPLIPQNNFVPDLWARRERRTWFVVVDEWLEDWPRADRAAFRSYLKSECRVAAEFPVPQPFRDLNVRVYLRE